MVSVGWPLYMFAAALVMPWALLVLFFVCAVILGARADEACSGIADED